MRYQRLLIGILLSIIIIIIMLYSYQEYDKNDTQIKKYKMIFKNSENYYNTEISFLAELININESNQSIFVSISERPYSYPRIVSDESDYSIGMVGYDDDTQSINSDYSISWWQGHP